MTDAEIVQDLRVRMKQLAAEGRFSGDVLLAKDGKPLFMGAYGYADHAFQARNTIDTKFNIFSIGKLFTTVAILQLAQQGKLSLDEPLIQALPDYPNKKIAERITIQELLDQRSGLADFFGKTYDDSNPVVFRTLRDYLPLFVNKPLLFEPGSRTAYSSAGFIVLGLVVERISGVSYFDYVREHIFVPAGMTETGFWSCEDDIPNLALVYTAEPSDKQPGTHASARKVYGSYSSGSSAGGAHSTLRDMMRFSEALRKHALLKASSFNLMLNGSYEMSAGSLHGVRYTGHGGGRNNTYLEMYPDLGYVTVVLSNYDGAATLVFERLRKEIAGGD